jgi:predicted choloylglycine hydrolase
VEQQGTIRELPFTGSHFERGLQRGELLRESFVAPPVPGVTAEFVQACFDLTARVYPPVIEEFEGIVRGGGFGRDAMMAYYFGRLESQLGGCTMVAVAQQRRSSGLGPLVGRNYDWAISDLRWCALHRLEPPDAPRRIGYTHHWAGYPDCLNERGLYVAIASLPPVPVRAPGIQWSVLVDMISETCVSADEGAELCARVRHLRSISYLLADGDGGMCAVEATPEEVRCRMPREGVLVVTNAPQRGRLAGKWEPEPPGGVPHPDIELDSPGRHARGIARSDRRQRRAEELLDAAGDGISREGLAALLADHAAPTCICPESRPDGGRWGTIWSGLCEPAAGEFLIAPGPPCSHPYERFSL